MRYLVKSLINLALISWMVSFVAIADQNDARLDELFSELHALDNIAKSQPLTNEIWTIWHITSNQRAADKFESGLRAMSERQLSLAVAAFSDVIELAPDFAEGWNKRATVYYMMGKHTESAADVKRTLELEPRHFGALAGLGLLLMAARDYPGAKQAFTAALEANPHLPGAIQNLKIIEELIEKQKQSESGTKI